MKMTKLIFIACFVGLVILSCQQNAKIPKDLKIVYTLSSEVKSINDSAFSKKIIIYANNKGEFYSNEPNSVIKESHFYINSKNMEIIWEAINYKAYPDRNFFESVDISPYDNRPIGTENSDKSIVTLEITAEGKTLKRVISVMSRVFYFTRICQAINQSIPKEYQIEFTSLTWE